MTSFMAVLRLVIAVALHWNTSDPVPQAVDHHATSVTTGSQRRIHLRARRTGNHVVHQQRVPQNTQLRDAISAVLQPDGSLGPWTAAGALDSACATHGAFVHAGYVYVAGGSRGRQVIADVFIGRLP